MFLMFVINLVVVIVLSMSVYAVYLYCRRRIQRALDERQERREAYAVTVREIDRRRRELAVDLRTQWDARSAERTRLDDTVKTLATVPAVTRRNAAFLRSLHFGMQTPQMQLPLDGIPTLRQPVRW